MSSTDSKPEVKHTVFTLVNAVQTLNELSDEKLDVEVSKRILQLIDWMQPYLDEFNEVRQKALEQYGVENKENPTMRDIPAEKAKEFGDALQQEGRKPITIPSKHKFSLNEFKTTKISFRSLGALRPFLTDL